MPSIIDVQSSNANGETYDCNNEGNPHEKIETPEDIVDGLKPVLSGRGANDVFTIFQSAFDGSGLEADGGTARVPNIDVIHRDKVNIDGSNGVRGVNGFLGLGIACNLFVDADRKSAVSDGVKKLRREVGGR